jgi:hypothetical protein
MPLPPVRSGQLSSPIAASEARTWSAASRTAAKSTPSPGSRSIAILHRRVAEDDDVRDGEQDAEQKQKDDDRRGR